MNRLITKDYEDGSRLRRIQALLQGNVPVEDVTVAEPLIHVTSQQCLDNGIDPKALIAFSALADLKRETKDIAIYEYPVDPNSNKIHDFRAQYNIDLKDIHNIMNLASNQPLSGVIQKKLLPKSEGKMHDGQLKIIVDFALAVDDVLSQIKDREIKILVIGSSSPDTVSRCGLAYLLIDHIPGDFTVRLVDPYETPGIREVDKNGKKIYIREARKLDYRTLDAAKYDLILDDSWEENKCRSQRDRYGRVYDCKNFSIKSFPWDKLVAGNIYRQKFFTHGKEFRMVTRDVKYFNYRSNRILGNCAGCRELIHRLRNVYSDGYYNYIMNNHYKKCVTGKLNFELIVDSTVSWVQIADPDLNLADYHSIMTLDFIPGTQKLRKYDDFTGKKVLFTNRLKVPLVVYDEASQVIVREQDDSGKVNFFVSRLIAEKVISVSDPIPNMLVCNVPRNLRHKSSALVETPGSSVEYIGLEEVNREYQVKDQSKLKSLLLKLPRGIVTRIGSHVDVMTIFLMTYVKYERGEMLLSDSVAEIEFVIAQRYKGLYHRPDDFL